MCSSDLANERTTALQFLKEQQQRLGAKGATQSARGFAAEKMPYRDGVAAVIAPDMGSDALAVPDSPSFPTGDFTIEANILARTVDRTAAVRTIAAKWSGENTKPGWGFALTGDGSRRKPRTLVLQIIGVKQDGSFGEEAIFSDQVLGLAKPYAVAASVKLATASAPGEVVFYVKDLSNDDEPLSIAKVPHKITGGFANPLALNLGGRAGRAAASPHARRRPRHLGVAGTRRPRLRLRRRAAHGQRRRAGAGRHRRCA